MRVGTKRSEWPRSRSVSAPSSVTNTSPCWNGDIVPGSTLMYGSSFRWVTRTPREARIAASDAAAMPFPREETTPPVTNTNLGMGDKFRKSAFYRTRRAQTIWSAAPIARVGDQRSADSLQRCRKPGERPLATEERQHRVDRRRLARAADEHPHRHHHLAGLDPVLCGLGLHRRAERLARPSDVVRARDEIRQRSAS